LDTIRGTLARLLGVHAQEAASGEWWEIDLILVVLAGAAVMGGIAWIAQ
jgi:hypothetical protein